MLLDELTELVGRLKERIEKHEDVLSKNETATRYALIDPLLTALGWDLQDPGQVRMEYDTGKGRVDYAMFARGGGDTGSPELVVEAKNLGKPTSDGIDQSINYCLQDGVPCFVVTNGDAWEAYDLRKDGKLTDRRMVDFSLTATTQTTVMKMLWLWRGNFESESPIMPVVPDRPASQQTSPSTPLPPAAEPPSNVERSDRGIPLDEFNPNRGDSPPAAVLFPDGTKKKIAIWWFEIQTTVVEWLIETGRLTEADCPVRGSKSGYLVHTSPVHKNGSPFRGRKQVGNLWIDSTADVPGQARKMKSILKVRNVDLSHVRVLMKT